MRLSKAGGAGPVRLSEYGLSRSFDPRGSVRPEDSVSARGSVQIAQQYQPSGVHLDPRRALPLSQRWTGEEAVGIRRMPLRTDTSSSLQPRSTPRMRIHPRPATPTPTYEREKPFTQHAYYDDLRIQQFGRGLPCCCCE